MKKFSLLFAALFAVGCSNQTTQSAKEVYVGETPIKFPAPKAMEEVTPKMGIVYELAKQIESAESRNYYVSHYVNLNDVVSTGRSCAVYMPKSVVYPKIPYDTFVQVKDLAKTELDKIFDSESVQETVKSSNNKVSEYVGDREEYLGVKLLNRELLYEDTNTLVQAFTYENKIKSEGKIQKTRDMTALALSYVKEKMLGLKCQGKPEDNAYLSSLVLEWNKAFLAANK